MAISKLLLTAVCCVYVLALTENIHAFIFRKNKKNERIVGGQTATLGQFPYMASLQFHGRHFCGGAIISPNWILTAAHCMLLDFEASKITAVVGSTDVSSGFPYVGKTKKWHDGFRNETNENDIGLLQTQDSIKFGDTVKPANIGTFEVGSYIYAVVCGFGATVTNGTSSESLQYLVVQTISNSICQRLLRRATIFETELCTLSPRGQGTCNADSGGPLAIGNTVVGIVAFGVPCARGFPDVYTKVASYNSWIMDYIGD